jgi:aspartate/glutamate racemase
MMMKKKKKRNVDIVQMYIYCRSLKSLITAASWQKSLHNEISYLQSLGAEFLAISCSNNHLDWATFLSYSL